MITEQYKASGSQVAYLAIKLERKDLAMLPSGLIYIQGYALGYSSARLIHRSYSVGPPNK